MTAIRYITDPYEPSRPLETVPPQMVPILIEALNTTKTAQLLIEAQAHLVGDDHNRKTCPCGTCNLYRRIRIQLGKEPS